MEKEPSRRKSRCPKCFKEMLRKNIKDHVKQVHDKDNNAFCNKCDKSFPNNSHLVRHVKHVHDGIKRTYKKVQCTICGKQVNKIKKHTKAVHNRCYDCNKCEKSFARWSELNKHVKVCHDKVGENNFKVKYRHCNAEIPNKTTDATILLEKHSKLEQELVPMNKMSVYIPCHANKFEYEGPTNTEIECLEHDGSKESLIKFDPTELQHEVKSDVNLKGQFAAIWLACPVIGCNLTFQYLSHLNTHLESIHELLISSLKRN